MRAGVTARHQGSSRHQTATDGADFKDVEKPGGFPSKWIGALVIAACVGLMVCGRTLQFSR